MARANSPAQDEAKTAQEIVAEVVQPSIGGMQLDPWEQAIQGADVVLGRELTKDEIFDKLVGVPFLITGIITYPGKGLYEKADGTKIGRDFFTCEARLAPANVMQQRRVNLDDLLPLEPNGLIVFNDSSTGIRRQLTQYLYGSGIIRLAEPLVPGGPLGQSSFDAPVSEWSEAVHGEIKFDPEGNSLYILNALHGWRGLVCPRGIRVSDYVNEYTDEGKTRYLA